MQLQLDSAWDANCANSENLDESLGKVIFNQPSGKKQKKAQVTFILQDATPNTTYTVGFNIFVATCDDAPTTFGVNRTLCVSGTVGCQNATAGVYVVGTLTTDAEGDGSLHVNLTNLPFWDVQSCLLGNTLRIPDGPELQRLPASRHGCVGRDCGILQGHNSLTRLVRLVSKKGSDSSGPFFVVAEVLKR